MVVRVNELSDWDKRKVKSRTNDFLGARQSLILVETLERNVKYVTSAIRESVSGTLIGFSEVLEKVTSVIFET